MNKFVENDIFLSLCKGENICRFCFSNLNEDIKAYSIFEDNIHEILQYCLWNQIKFNEGDSIPKLICLNCYISLENTCNFLDIIIRSQDIISKFIEQKGALEKNNESLLENEDNGGYILIEKLDDSLASCEKTDCRSDDEETRPLKKKAENNKPPGKADKKFLSNKLSQKTRAVIGKIGKNKKCCGQDFGTKTEYYSHVRKRKTYECSECNKKYVSYFELEIHLRKHSGERPFQCVTCEKSFIDKRNLRKHEKIHLGNKEHECSVCQKKFLHLFTLKTHERIHTGKKPFVCERCGKPFNTSTEMKIHYRTHTKEKPYKCNSCDKAFSSKAALNTHILVHTGEKKYGCTICSRKCRTAFDLKTHMRSHSNEKPYACRYAQCDKKYRNSSQLNVHLRTHKGEKTHQCVVCCKKFGESNTLKRHMGIHEKNVERIT